jgi:hypothetical protein
VGRVPPTKLAGVRQRRRQVVMFPGRLKKGSCRSALKSALTQFWCSLGTCGTFAGIDDKSVISAAAKSKTAAWRLIRMEPNLIQWLSPFTGRIGPIFAASTHVLANRMHPIRKAAGLTKWPENGLRHSFASYHLAKFQDAARLALDMGHSSTKMIFSNYREVVRPEEAERYWNILPVPPRPTNVVPIARGAA